RNDLNIDESELPCVIVLDGDEEVDPPADTSGLGRPSRGPQIMRMYPQVYFALAEHPDTVGQDLNALRGRLIHAVLSDVELQSLCHNREIRYEGMESDLALGRTISGQAGMQFSMPYVLYPDDLVPAETPT